MSVTDLPKLYTEKDVAGIFGCSPITVKRERDRGRLGYTLIAGRMIRYTQAHIDAYLRGNSCATTSGQPSPAASGTSIGPNAAAAHDADRLALEIATSQSAGSRSGD